MAGAEDLAYGMIHDTELASGGLASTCVRKAVSMTSFGIWQPAGDRLGQEPLMQVAGPRLRRAAPRKTTNGDAHVVGLWHPPRISAELART